MTAIILDSIHRCGDDKVDLAIKYYVGGVQLDYTELCDDGNIADNDGCNRSCGFEPQGRSHGWSDPFIERERVPYSNTYGAADCPSLYLPAEVYDTYNPRPSSYKCYYGKYCYDCSSPKFPGYSNNANKFLDISPYANLPHRSRGRLRVLNDGNSSMAYTFVVNDAEVFITDSGRTEIPHNGVAATRQSLGKYFIISSGTNSFNIYTLKQGGGGVYSLVKKDFVLTKLVAPQLGSEFFIWWPGANYLLSRSYNQRNFEIYSLHNLTFDAIDNPANYPEHLRIDGPYMPEFALVGDIPFEPVFRNDVMYLPVYSSTFNTVQVNSTKVHVYSTNLPWEIKFEKSVTVGTPIRSMASFPGGVIATHNSGSQFINIDTGTAPTVTYTSTAPTCTLSWKFIQARPHPDNSSNYPDVYAFCIGNIIYPVTFTAGSNTLTIDVANAIIMPDDAQFSRNKKGRFNLDYPYDISGQYLVNFAIHPCSTYQLYKWDIWNYMSVSIFNLGNKTASCMDITNSDAVFE